MSGRLLSAVSKLLPEADICLLSERPWFSATFAGVQISLHAALSSANRVYAADQFARILKTHQFDVPGYIVADIGVVRQVDDEYELRLTIDALLLEN